MDATWTLRLYPRAWRERYGGEMLAVLEQHEATLGTALDLLRGALDARLHPRLACTAAEPAAVPAEPAPTAAPPAPEDDDEALRRRLRQITQWTGGREPAGERALRAAQHVDRMVRVAQVRGDFDHLRLHGRPIPAELLQPADGGWPTNAMLAGAGFLPAWLQLQQEIDAELAECRRLVERVECYPPRANRTLPERELQARLAIARAQTRRYNLMVPTPLLQRPLPRADELERRLRRALAAAESASSTV